MLRVMSREFNVAGLCRPELHYLISPTRRVAEVLPLIEAQGYFVIHGPRQVGKTTALFGLARELGASGRHVAAVLSCESGRAFGDDPNEAQAHIARHWIGAAAAQLEPELGPPATPANGWPSLRDLLQTWASRLDRPLVVFLDELDALSNPTLLTMLADLRAGFTLRPRAFPAALALVGTRDLGDYKIRAGGSDSVDTSSPFNVKLASLLVRNFTHAEVGELYDQHTAETGQRFDPSAVDVAFELTDGQPWLVNALAREAVMSLVTHRPEPITREHILTAKERLIVARGTHLDSVAARLREPRVRAIIEPMMAGEYLPGQVPEDDYDYLLELGLLKRDEGGSLVVANAIYREVIPGVLRRRSGR
jgi:hypothetical protein